MTHTETAARGIPEEFIKDLQERTGYTNFVETGTHAGWTIDTVLPLFQNILTVEWTDLHYKRAVEKYKDHKHVRLFHGSSRDLLGTMLGTLDGPSIIWLDAHFSGGDTGHDKKGHCPVREELAAIRESGEKRNVILIDDAVDFTGGTYPSEQELVTMLLEINPRYEISLVKERRGIYMAFPIV